MRVTLINLFYTPDISPTAHLCASLAEYRAAQGDDVTVLTSRAGYLRRMSTETVASRFSRQACLPSRSMESGRQACRVNLANDAGSTSADVTHANKGRVHVRRLWSSTFGSRSNLGRLLDWLTFYLPACCAALTLPPQDVVICLTTPPFIALAGWLHKLRNPSARLILWNMDTYPEALERTGLVRKGGLVAQIMRAIHRVIFRRLDHLVALDRAMNDLLLGQYQPADRSTPATIIPNWERLALFPAETKDGQWDDPLARALVGRFVVLYLGNAGFGHEFRTMLDAAEMLRQEPVTFLFVGGGALRPWIDQQRSHRRLGNIVLHGYVPKEQTPAVMRRADCALITLDDDMLGVMSPSKLHANLAMGLPILYVGPAGGNVDDAIAKTGCGASLRCGDAASLAALIRQWRREPARHQLLREQARRAFEQFYCDEKALELFDGVFEKASAHFRGSTA